MAGGTRHEGDKDFSITVIKVLFLYTLFQKMQSHLVSLGIDFSSPAVEAKTSRLFELAHLKLCKHRLVVNFLHMFPVLWHTTFIGSLA